MTDDDDSLEDEPDNEYDEYGSEVGPDVGPISELINFDELTEWSKSEIIMGMVGWMELNYGKHPIIEKLMALLAYLEELNPQGFEALNRSDVLMTARLCRTVTNYIDDGNEPKAHFCAFMVSALYSDHLCASYLSAMEKCYVDSINFPHVSFVKSHWN